ncbi:MAG: ABC transporter ATP-binding protein [Desulfatiglandales bacterium]
MTQLTVEGLSISYGGIKALRSVSLEIKRDELVSIIGANGAGKSTLLKGISGLVRCESGKILFQGKDITNRPPHLIVKAGISQVPEGRRIFSRLTVLENLWMGAYTRSSKEEAVEDMEEVFSLFPRLKERKDQVAGTLSGGEQQMLAIGRALMGRPRLLLLDEPSMGLAPILVEHIFTTIKRIHAEGTGILLVEQNAFAALEISHRTYILQTGSIVMEGKSKEIMERDDVKRAYLDIR